MRARVLALILRASSENAATAEALGVGVPRVFAATFALGAGLAGLAGALAAPIYQVSPLMGSDILLVVFAIIVIGGMGSIGGTIVSSYALALIESLTQALVPQAASFIVFAFMCVVLLLRPQGLFGISVVRSHEFLAARLPWIEPADKETAAKRLTGMVPVLAAVSRAIGAADAALSRLSDEDLLFHHLRRFIQFPAGVCRHHVVRPGGLVRYRGLSHSACGKGVGAATGSRDRRRDSGGARSRD